MDEDAGTGWRTGWVAGDSGSVRGSSTGEGIVVRKVTVKSKLKGQSHEHHFDGIRIVIANSRSGANAVAERARTGRRGVGRLAQSLPGCHQRTFRGPVELQARAGPLVDCRMRRAHRGDGNLHPELDYRAGAERTGGAGKARLGPGERQIADDYGG